MVEIARFSTKLNYNIVGGFSKLLKATENWIEDKFIGIITYADLRFGEGKVYSKNNFKLEGQTAIDFWYSNGVVRFNRLKYKAQPGKTEKEIAKENNVFKIYGCGSNIYSKFNISSV